LLFSNVSGQQQIDYSKNVGKLLTISIAMRMRRYDVESIAGWRKHPGLHSKPLDATPLALVKCLRHIAPAATMADEFE